MRRAVGAAVFALAFAACGRADFDPVGQFAPLAWFPLDDDPATGSYQDTIGGFVATCTPGNNCPTRGPGRSAAAAAQFDGSSQFLSITAPAFAFQPPYTIAAWVRLDLTVTDFDCAVCRPLGANVDDTYALFASNSGDLATFTTPGPIQAAGPPIPLATWTHVAGTFDGATIRLYVNGLLAGTQTATDASVDAHATMIGADMDFGATAGFFHGALADIRVFSDVLTTAELAALAQ